jgi:hypothetical protein
VITVDTLAPTTTAAVIGANDNVDPTTGNVATGGTSNDNTLGLSGTVSAALTSGDVVAVYDASTRLGVATVSGTTWTFDTAGLTNAAHSLPRPLPPRRPPPTLVVRVPCAWCQGWWPTTILARSA